MSRPRASAGFTLMEVLIAFAVLGTAYVAVLGLLTQSLTTMDRLTRRFEAELWSEDAYVRFVLAELGYDVESVHPALRERHLDWDARVEEEELSPDDLPVTVPFPVGWDVTWVNVAVEDELGNTVASMRPLWARNAASMVDKTDEDVVFLEEAPQSSTDAEAGKPRSGIPDRTQPRQGFRSPWGGKR